MRFTELDELARKDETPEERTYHDQRRAELRAALYAGIAIRDAREEAGLSQTELAARIGIAQSALSRIEAGRANLTLGWYGSRKFLSVDHRNSPGVGGVVSRVQASS